MEMLGPADVTMSQWNIIVIVYEGEKIEKFLGYWHQRGTCRISSQIESYDSEANTGKTLSGSRYKFLDKPGALHPEAQAIYDALDKADDVDVYLMYSSIDL